MDLTRTKWAIIILFVGAILGLVFTTLGVLNPEMARTGGTSPGEGPQLIAIVVGITSLLMGLASLVGTIMLLTDASSYGKQHRLFAIIALVLLLASAAMIVQSTIGAISYTRSGDESAYRISLIVGAVRAGVAALVASVAAWYLFKPAARTIPAVTAVVRAAAGVGFTLVTMAHTTLGETSIQGQTIFMPQYDVPADSGPIYIWMVVGWAGAVLLAGMWAALLFAAEDVMVPLPEKVIGESY
jgi:hypothetical protein